MKFLCVFSRITLTTVCIVMSSVFAQAQLIQNGSFESDLAGWSTEMPGGSFVTAGSGEYFGVTADTGTHYVVFNAGTTPAGALIFQNFTTSIGTRYTVSYAISRAGLLGNGVIGIQADIFNVGDTTSVIATSSAYRAPVDSYAYSHVNFSFTAIGTTSQIRFTDVSFESFQYGSLEQTDTILDSASVTAITPEPASIALFVLCGSTVLRRRRKQ